MYCSENPCQSEHYFLRLALAVASVLGHPIAVADDPQQGRRWVAACGLVEA
jgi:hypothetical protein